MARTSTNMAAMMVMALALLAVADAQAPTTEQLVKMRERLVDSGARKLTVSEMVRLIEKVEKQYATWSPLDVADALRRMCSYDTEHWRRLIGAKSPGKEIKAGAHLSADDLDHLWLLLRRETSSKFGIATDPTGIKINTAHAVAAVAGGQRRNPRASFSNWNYVGVGSLVDNLYIASVSGDLGQTACEQLYGKQQGYVGEGTEMTIRELVADVDGLLMGLHIKALGGVSKASAARVSAVLRSYYLTKSVAAANVANRWHLAAYTIDWTEVTHQAVLMTDSYKLKYSKKNLFSSATEAVLSAAAEAKVELARMGPMTAAEFRSTVPKYVKQRRVLNVESFDHQSTGSTPALYRRGAAGWEVSFNNARTFQPVTQQKLTYDFQGTKGNRTPSFANLRLMAYLAKHPDATLAAR